jgi:hypothetical protein
MAYTGRANGMRREGLMKENVKIACLLVAFCLSAIAGSFLFEGVAQRWTLIFLGAAFFFLWAMELYKREMREIIRAELHKVRNIMSVQFEKDEYRHEETVRRLGEIEEKLDALSRERR